MCHKPQAGNRFKGKIQLEAEEMEQENFLFGSEFQLFYW